MAYNPPIQDNGAQALPCKVDGEMFVLERDNMDIEVKVDGNKEFGKKKGNGKLFMTTCRLVWINKKHAKESFKAFDIPLANLRKESFEQPVFGSNYLKGDVLPLYNLIPGVGQFKLWFKSGGCSVFLKMLDQLLNSVRRNRNRGPDRKFMNDVATGNIRNQQALYDPNDPTVIYMTQPSQQLNQNETQQQQNFYGPNLNGANPYYNYPEENQPLNQQPPQQQQFNQPPQQQQFNQPPQQFNQPNQQPQPFNQAPGQNFNQFNQQSQNMNMNQAPPQPQFQPQQQSNQFSQYNPQQQQYQSDPTAQQNFNMNPQQQQQINNMNQPQMQQQDQQGKYFGFWGPSLQGNQNQQQQQQQPQPFLQNNQFQQQPPNNNQQFQQYQPQPQPQQQGQFQQYQPQPQQQGQFQQYQGNPGQNQ